MSKRNIVLGVCGGIAAYKAVALTSMLVKSGYNVWVIMTESATKFVTPLTFQTISRNPVYVDTFEEREPQVVSHIDLADRADLFVVAPATANIIGKLAGGIADDMLSTTLLATTAPVVIAPAMNVHMYTHPAVQENMEKLKKWGYQFIEPGEGPLACGYTGKGRLEEPEAIFAWIDDYFKGKKTGIISPNPDPDLESRKLEQSSIKLDLMGKTVLITAGPTQEAIDPVRFITNRSSGKMGYSIALACKQRGARVILVTGKTSIQPPEGVEVHSVISAQEMAEIVMALQHEADWIIGTAAVADYRPKHFQSQKIKKKEDEFILTLVKNPDILQQVGNVKRVDQVLIGFAAETENVVEHAKAKIVKKNLDYIIANDVSEEGSGFDSDTNRVTILSKHGAQIELPMLPKTDLAHKIIDIILEDLRNQP
jgi:phosphopantothenoylcysteine decarboxylase/phosphopantothenate--cysteine ligase